MAKEPFLLERARREGTPLIDGQLARDSTPFSSGGAECHVTFVWHGKQAPGLSGDFNYWASDHGGQSPSAPIALTRVEPNVWAHTLVLPRTAYVEYIFLSGDKRILDPFNARKMRNGIGGINNFFYAPDAQPTPFLKTAHRAVRGRVTTHTLDVGPMVIGGTRRVHLYAPPTQEPARLVVALDGQDYMRLAKLPALLDNLYIQHKIPPLALAMPESTRAGKRTARMSEYACSELTLIFILQRVLPLAQEHLNLVDMKRTRGAFAVLGASMGGLQALYTALRAPAVFDTVISQAGAFDLWGYPTVPHTLLTQAKTKPRVWLDVGRMDWLLESNRRMYRALKRSKFEAKLREYVGYHNWTSWRNTLPEALMWAFPKSA